MPEINIPKTELLPIEELSSDGKNPNKLPKKKLEALKENIKKYGWIVPIITNKEGIIADGEHRWEAAKSLRMTEVPVIKLDVAEVDRRMLRQVLNKLKGDHDPTLDMEEFKYFIEEGQFDEMERLLGERQSEIMKLLEGEDEEESDDDVAAMLAEKPEPRIKPGEVWRLGDHKLLCGDSTDPKNWIKLMGDEKAHLIMTDPPYNLAFNSTSKGRFEVMANDYLDDDVFKEVITQAVKNAHEYLQPTASIYYCIDWRSYDTLKQVLQQHYNLRAAIVWVKEFGGLGWHYRFRHELIIYGTHGENPVFNSKGTAEDVWEIKSSKEGPKFHLSNQGVYIETPNKQYIRLSKIDAPTKRAKVVPFEEPGITFSTVLDQHTDVWELSSLNSFQGRNRDEFQGFDHPTIKPLSLVCRAIKHSSNQGHIVIDQFAGSGSTLLGCEKTNRQCRAIELDPIYCEVIIRRWERVTAQKAEKISGGDDNGE